MASRSQRTRTRLAVVGVAVFALAMAVPATAAAGSGTTVTPYTVSYSGVPVNGNLYDVTCSGINVVTAGPHATNRDIERCVWTGDLTGFVRGHFQSDRGSPAGAFPPFGPYTVWFSDDGINGLANSWSAVVTFNRDGTLTITSISRY